MTQLFSWATLAIGLSCAGLSRVQAATASFTWDASPDAATGKALGYRFYYSTLNFTSLPADALTNPAFKVVTVTTGTTVNLTDLVSGQPYFMTVTAYGANGLESPPSNILTYTPDAPLGVAITSLPPEITVASDAVVTVTASANGPAAVSKVEFFDGAFLLTTVTAPPYSFNRTFAPGVHALTAKVTDANNNTAVSLPVTVTVTAPVVNVPPTVAFTSPVNNSQFTPGQAVIISATAADADGSISRVEFYDGVALIATRSTAPYSTTISSLASGAHTLTAKAVDNVGAVASASVNVTVASGNASPAVSFVGLVDGAQISQPVVLTVTASDNDGTVASVQFFANDTLLGTATTAPYTISLPIVSGTYVFKAKATDNQGAATFSGPITATVKPTPPVNLTVK